MGDKMVDADLSPKSIQKFLYDRCYEIPKWSSIITIIRKSCPGFQFAYEDGLKTETRSKECTGNPNGELGPLCDKCDLQQKMLERAGPAASSVLKGSCEQKSIISMTDISTSALAAAKAGARRRRMSSESYVQRLA